MLTWVSKRMGVGTGANHDKILWSDQIPVPKGESMLTRFSCGHVGAMAKPKESKAGKTFIRWAEIRGNMVKDAVDGHGNPISCPDCGTPGANAV